MHLLALLTCTFLRAKFLLGSVRGTRFDICKVDWITIYEVRPIMISISIIIMDHR